jgi:hypothetical protein
MFNFFKKKDIKIYPVKASQSIASLALLIDSRGYPFSDWKVKDINLTEDEENLIEPACQCLQLFFYRYAYNEKHLLGEVMLGCVLSVVKENNPELANLYELGIELFEETMLFLFNQSMNKQELLANLPSYFAVNWERNYNQEDTSKEVRTQTANKLLQCLLHSRTSGDSVLQPMIDSIVDFDLEEIEQISFRKNMSLYEDVLYKRLAYPFLFRHMKTPNASLLLACRQREKNLALDFSSEKDSIEKTFIDNISNDGLTFQLLRDSYLNFIKAIDEIRAELSNIGGTDCNVCLKEVELSRKKINELYLKLIADSLPEKLDSEIEFCLKLDEIYLDVKDLFNITKHIDSDETMSYILTLDDVSISKYTEAIKIEVIVDYLKKASLIEHFSDEEKDFVNSKIRLFSVL